MKYVLAIGINIFLIALCMFLLHTYDVHAVKANDLNKDVNLSTSVGNAIINNNNTSKLKNGKNNSSLNTIELSLTNAGVIPVAPVVPVVKNEVSAPALSNVTTPSLEKQVGTISAYGPDCRGCSGHLGGGFDASDGSYIYTDPTYGNVRIVAGDPQYPYGTIIRVSNTKAGDFNAIVLDRGGDIGIGRRFLFDLLFPSEADAAAFGTSYDVTVDVLRFGY